MGKTTVMAACLLAAQVPAGAAIAQGTAPQVVSVELSNFKFSPSALTLRHGQAYRLHLVNSASGAHDFAAPEFFAASSIAAANRGSVVGGKVKLAGHQTVDIELTPQKPGSYELRCSHFMHSSFGMTGSITVQ